MKKPRLSIYKCVCVRIEWRMYDDGCRRGLLESSAAVYSSSGCWFGRCWTDRLDLVSKGNHARFSNKLCHFQFYLLLLDHGPAKCVALHHQRREGERERDGYRRHAISLAMLPSSQSGFVPLSGSFLSMPLEGMMAGSSYADSPNGLSIREWKNALVYTCQDKRQNRHTLPLILLNFHHLRYGL